VLWEIQIEGLRRYRCRVGHAWSPESLLTQQSEALEAALWIALRTLEERAALARRLAEPARRRGHSITATRFEEQATEAQHAARLLRNLLLDRGSLATAWPRPPSTTRRIRPLRRRRPGYADKQVEGSHKTCSGGTSSETGAATSSQGTCAGRSSSAAAT
jgi:hypothetical protein